MFTKISGLLLMVLSVVGYSWWRIENLIEGRGGEVVQQDPIGFGVAGEVFLCGFYPLRKKS